MNAEQWIAQFAEELGIDPPTPDEFDEILRLAAVAAHCSERPAAPVATWLAGKSSRPLADLLEAAERHNPNEPHQ